ncbi:acyl-CoA thioesterase [Microbulbifer sp. 2201CG32-9]|uniref:acyl-CoA thioesterase n=1 Tax=Microbulbifer sp. 2201CG32-9 TaxID=3232309 RepID=UPI00345C5468
MQQETASQFQQLLTQLRSGDNLPEIPAGWQQGRATFGGLVAAMLYERMATQLDSDADLRSLTVSFVAPASPGKVDIHTDVLRRGRSVTQVEGRLCQGKVVLAALASFGKPRESSISIASPPAPPMPAPEESQALPYIEGLVPEFTRHFDYRIALGDLPYSNSDSTSFGGWVRFREPCVQTASEPVGVSHLLALIDAWPPAVLPMLKELAPASSLTWTLEFVGPRPRETAGTWWQYLAEVKQAADGYSVIQARLWSAGGQLVAFTRQTVAVFG